MALDRHFYVAINDYVPGIFDLETGIRGTRASLFTSSLNVNREVSPHP